MRGVRRKSCVRAREIRPTLLSKKDITHASSFTSDDMGKSPVGMGPTDICHGHHQRHTGLVLGRWAHRGNTYARGRGCACGCRGTAVCGEKGHADLSRLRVKG